MTKRRCQGEQTYYLTHDGFLFEGPDDRGMPAEDIRYPLTIHAPSATAEPFCRCENAMDAVAYLRRIDGKTGVSIWRRKNLEAWFERGRPFTAMDGGLTEKRYRGEDCGNSGALPSTFF